MCDSCITEDSRGRLWLYHLGREPELITGTTEEEILQQAKDLLQRDALGVVAKPNGYCIKWTPTNPLKWYVDGALNGEKTVFALSDIHDIARDLVSRYPTSKIEIHYGADLSEVYKVQ